MLGSHGTRWLWHGAVWVGLGAGLVGCPRRNDPPPPACTYTEADGNCFTGELSLDDARVMAVDPATLSASPEACRPPVLVRVTHVRDGDTVDVVGVSDPTVMTGVRLIGVNSPEIAHPDMGEPTAQCFGPEALGFTLALENRLVWLTFDRDCSDPYDRLLAFVWVGGGQGDLWQRQLLRRGFARTLTVAPNDALAPMFAADEAQAMTDGRGLWNACAM